MVLGERRQGQLVEWSWPMQCIWMHWEWQWGEFDALVVVNNAMENKQKGIALFVPL